MNQNPKILSGTELSSAVFSKLSNRIVNLKNKSITPTLAVILVGENPASKVYVRNKTKRFEDTEWKDAYIVAKYKEEVKISFDASTA